MYDTIKIRINGSLREKGNGIEKRFGCKEILEKGNEVTKCTNIENLSVKMHEHQITIVGSIAKYYCGSNLNTLTLNEFNKAIESLEHALKLNLRHSYVSRFDIGENFMLDDDLQGYLFCLEYLDGFNKKEHKHGVSFEKYDKALSFYDKRREMIKDKVAIDENLAGKNILRYEMKFLQRTNRIFKKDAVTIEDLRSAKFYNLAVEMWAEEYDKIIKKSYPVFTGAFKSVKHLRNELAAIGSEKYGGETSLRKLLKLEHRKKTLDSVQVSRIKTVLSEIFKRGKHVFEETPILELNSKVLQARLFNL